MMHASLERVPHIIGPRGADGRIPLIDDVDQIDGQASVILAWALLALARGPGSFEDESFLALALLMDRSSDAPYLGRWTRWRIDPGLVLNTHFEHSREWNYWIGYDLLSQSFMMAALDRMIAVARRRGAEEESRRWAERRQRLSNAIDTSMIIEREGEPTYAEMLLPTGRAPQPYPGLSWVALSPVAAGWHDVNRGVLDATIRIWQKNARVEWDGPAVTACEWDPGTGHTGHTYGKILGWELLHAAQIGEWARACAIADFLEAVNDSELYVEIFRIDPASRRWTLRDAGNGEQAAWLSWSLMRARQEAGLSPRPALR